MTKIELATRWSFILIILVILSLQSCSKEEFAARPAKSTTSLSALETYTMKDCALMSTNKPKVDFLFLWDNSSSQVYVMDNLKAALSSIVNNIAAHFDYHILMAPLIGSNLPPDTPDSDMSRAKFVSYDTTNLEPSATNIRIPRENAADYLQSIMSHSAGTTYEDGMLRAYALINTNRSNQIFRNNAYTIVVLLSNGDFRVTAGQNNLVYDNKAVVDKLEIRQNLLMNLYSTMGGEQIRFMTLVSHTQEGGGYKIGHAYRGFSEMIYLDSRHKINPTGQGIPFDSYNIIGNQFQFIFSGINSSIQQVVVPHKYNYWPMGISQEFDPNTIKVHKVTGSGSYQLTRDDTINGFTYLGLQNNHPTRYYPTVGEYKTDHMVQLFGSGRATFPECIIVTAEEPPEYYGYKVLDGKPALGTITCKKNGTPISESSSNGWEYIDYKTDKNLKIESPSNPSVGGNPPDYGTGYMLKLNGSAILEKRASGGDSLSCIYDPSA